MIIANHGLISQHKSEAVFPRAAQDCYYGWGPVYVLLPINPQYDTSWHHETTMWKLQ